MSRSVVVLSNVSKILIVNSVENHVFKLLK